MEILLYNFYSRNLVCNFLEFYKVYKVYNFLFLIVYIIEYENYPIRDR